MVILFLSLNHAIVPDSPSLEQCLHRNISAGGVASTLPMQGVGRVGNVDADGSRHTQAITHIPDKITDMIR